MRSFLTMLGIIIGIAAVMVIVGLGNGMENYMTDMFKSIGTNICEVTLTGRDTSRTASVEDMYEVLRDNARYFDNMSPTVSMRGSIKVGTEELDYTSATGVAETYFEIKSYEIAQGRALHYMDMESRSRVCVIGSYVADEYYGGHAVGETIRINGTEFDIVGVMAQEDDEPARGMTDDVVYLPYSTAARLSGLGSVSSYSFTVIDEDNVAIAKTALENSLYDIFRSEDAAFERDDRYAQRRHHHFGRHRGYLARRRRRGHYEHHARFRYRAHARDRYSQGTWREGGLDHGAVCHRGGRYGVHRRHLRHHRGLWLLVTGNGHHHKHSRL